MSTIIVGPIFSHFWDIQRQITAWPLKLG